MGSANTGLRTLQISGCLPGESILVFRSWGGGVVLLDPVHANGDLDCRRHGVAVHCFAPEKGWSRHEGDYLIMANVFIVALWSGCM